MTAPPRVLLAVADQPGDAGVTGSSLAALRASQGRLRDAGWQLRVHSYAEVLAGIPDPPGGALCLLHFPYRYWDDEIEGKIPDTYGTGRYGALLRGYLLEAGAAIQRAVPDGLTYVNEPSAVALTRDKIALKERLAAAGVPTPRAFPVSSASDVESLLAAGRRLYVKAAHASMNKGMAVLSAKRWRTNYGFDGRVLVPGTPVGGSWRFHDIPAGDRGFLAAVCGTAGFLYEEAIDGDATGKGARHELRVTVAKGKIIAVEERSAPVSAATTSPAEGGRRLHRAGPPDPGALPPGAGDAALAATAAAGLQYAVHDIVLDHARRPFVVDMQAFPALGTSPRLFADLLASFTVPDSRADAQGLWISMSTP